MANVLEGGGILTKGSVFELLRHDPVVELDLEIAARDRVGAGG